MADVLSLQEFSVRIRSDQEFVAHVPLDIMEMVYNQRYIITRIIIRMISQVLLVLSLVCVISITADVIQRRNALRTVRYRPVLESADVRPDIWGVELELKAVCPRRALLVVTIRM